MIAVGRWRTVWRRRERLPGGEKRFTAAGKGDSARRRELLLVVARCRTRGRTVGGVTISDCSSSDFSLVPSLTRVGVLGGGETLLDSISISCHTRCVSGVTVSSDASRVWWGRFGRVMLS